MRLFKMAAESRGYELWYDRRLKMYALTAPNRDTEYFDTYLLTQMGLSKFIQVFLRKD